MWIFRFQINRNQRKITNDISRSHGEGVVAVAGDDEFVYRGNYRENIKQIEGIIGGNIEEVIGQI